MFSQVHLLVKTGRQDKILLKLLQFYQIFLKSVFNFKLFENCNLLIKFDRNLYNGLVLEVSQRQDLNTVIKLSVCMYADETVLQK